MVEQVSGEISGEKIRETVKQAKYEYLNFNLLEQYKI